MPFSPEYFDKFRIKPKPLPTPQSNLLWAYRTAKEAVRHPRIVDSDLFKQAYGYVKLGLGLEKTLGEAGAAERLRTEGAQFHGWSRDIKWRTVYYPME